MELFVGFSSHFPLKADFIYEELCRDFTRLVKIRNPPKPYKSPPKQEMRAKIAKFVDTYFQISNEVQLKKALKTIEIEIELKRTRFELEFIQRQEHDIRELHVLSNEDNFTQEMPTKLFAIKKFVAQ
jgi:hypothetical protein